MERLQGKVVAIAGAASGIGAGIVRRLVREGAQVAIGDIDMPTARKLAAESENERGSARPFEVNIDHDSSIAGFVAAVEEHYGGLDAFHANVANFSHGTADTNPVEMPVAVYDAIMHTNARGFFLCTRHAIPALLRRGAGVMLYTSSDAAHVPVDVRPAYAMSKAAVHALMRHVAVKWGPNHIRSNVIAPGVIITPRLESVFVGEMLAWAEDRMALKTRVGREEDVAAMAAHLISDDGAYITGQVLSVDGGSSMRP